MKTNRVSDKQRQALRLATTQNETVTDIETDHWGRIWGRIGEVRVWLTYAVDPNGTWLDTDGNYHFNAHVAKRP